MMLKKHVSLLLTVVSLFYLCTSLLYAQNYYMPTVEDVTVPGSETALTQNMGDQILRFEIRQLSDESGNSQDYFHVFTDQFFFNIVPYLSDIHCWQRVDVPQTRNNLSIDFTSDLFQGLSIERRTEGYVVFSNGNIKFAIHSDGTLWVYVQQPGEQIDLIPRINTDYDMGGGKFDHPATTKVETPSDYTDDQRKVVYTNWIAIEDERKDPKNIRTTGGFGVYLRPTRAYFQMDPGAGRPLRYWSRMERASIDNGEIVRIINTTEPGIHSQCSFVASIFPTKDWNSELDSERVSILYPHAYRRDKSNPGRKREFKLPNKNAVRAWCDTTLQKRNEIQARSARQPEPGFYYYEPRTGKPLPLTTLILFEDLWENSYERNPQQYSGSSIWDFSGPVPYHTLNRAHEDTLRGFIDMVHSLDVNLKVLLYVSACDEYNKMSTAQSTSEYSSEFLQHMASLMDRFNPDGIYIDTLPLNGNRSHALEPMIAAYQIMRDLKRDRRFKDKFVILHNSENPMGDKRTNIGNNVQSLVQFDIFAPFIERYADLLWKGEAYPMKIARRGKLVLPHVADHIKYCVSPRGKSNSQGFLDFTRLRDEVTGNKVKHDYFSTMYPVSLGDGSKNESWYGYNPDPRTVNDILINRLVITNTIYENYLLPRYLLQAGKVNDITDEDQYRVIRYEYRNTFTLQGPFTPEQDKPVKYGDVYGLRNPYINGFGPNYDYYRLVPQGWLREAYSTPDTLNYEMTFANDLDWRWYRRSTNDGRMFRHDQFKPLPQTTSDDYHLLMDDGVSDNDYSLNEIWFHMDLEGYKEIELSFWFKKYNEDEHPQDGVYFSEGVGKDYVKVYAFPDMADNRYAQINLDVDALAEENNLRLTSEFSIKFQQYDNQSIATGRSESDGIAIDNVRLTGRK